MKNIFVISVLSSILIFGLSSFLDGGNGKAVDPIVKAQVVKVFHKNIELRISLVNNSNDTLYYRSESCNPFIDNIEFSPWVFGVALIECAFSNPIMLKIAPHDTKIDTEFIYKEDKKFHYRDAKFRVGYLWIPLKKSAKGNLYADEVKESPEKVIWSDTLTLK